MKFEYPAKLRFGAGQLLIASAAVLMPSVSLAADAAATGVDASFVTLLGDLTGMLGGNFGAPLLLVSLIIAIGVYAITSNVRYVVASLAVALLIGYGVDIIQGIGGVSATTDLLVAEAVAGSADQAGSTFVQ